MDLTMQAHGGDCDRAWALYGGDPADWLDLSTGINPNPYPLPSIDPACWHRLPTKSDVARLIAVAASAFDTSAVVQPLAGAQSGIQLLPHLSPGPDVRVLVPTYREHVDVLRQSGYAVRECVAIGELAGADLAILVNPNNPDGKRYTTDDLRVLAYSVGLLVVDESFAEGEAESSLAPAIDPTERRILVLRSFGKFFGLAGLRLGFAIAGSALGERIQALVGPWPVSGPAIAIASQALADRSWQAQTCAMLHQGANRLDKMAIGAGWGLVGGTNLFRTYQVGDAAWTQRQLAHRHIWSRTFAEIPGWLRLGLPHGVGAWSKLARALTAIDPS